METYNIVAGFSDMKIQFRVATESEKLIRTLKLHFTYTDNYLCSHDSKDHKKVFHMAYFRPRKKEWINGMLPGTLGWDLMEYLFKKYPENQILEGINLEYKLHGYLPFVP